MNNVVLVIASGIFVFIIGCILIDLFDKREDE